ncbi:HK97 gp10 family phage protein [Thalassoglobus sp. JC818]|uniref:HK97 gp10 family phage protein n=1 Tax=Thalassoglobus sp. JC818 TaxID=3232136 RepID=UPI0034573BAC
MKIEIQQGRSLRESLRRLKDERTSVARREFVERLASAVIQETKSTNPVRTGRSRAGWVAPGPAGEDGGSEGSFTVSHTSQATEVSMTNSVPYVVFLEYGTSKTAPVAMVRKSLSRVAGRIASLFELR